MGVGPSRFKLPTMTRHKSVLDHILILLTLWPLCALSTDSELAQRIERGKAVYPLCASCHMANGWGKTDGSFPVIASQHPRVLLKQLEDIRTRKRENPTMFPFADPASIGGQQAMEDVAYYIASMKNNPDPGKGPGTHLKRGEQIYNNDCAVCHGKKGEGNNDAIFPKLQGQHYAYLLRQLKWIRDGYRKNSNPVMLKTIEDLKDDDLAAVADYASRLK